MEVWHRITFGHKDDVGADLDALHVQIKKTALPGTGYLIHIDINESDSRWPKVAALVREKNAVDICNTIFTSSEILSADWVRLVPVFQQGYPQPEETWVKNPINYEEHCPECGTFRQRASFRLKKEPVLGKNSFMSLYWTYALFCTTEVFSDFEATEIRGYEVWDAIIHKSNMPSEKVSQLFIPTIADPGLVWADDLKADTCPSCNVTKYRPHMRGAMYIERDALLPDIDIMQSYEWFGSGHTAYREILVSNRIARLVLGRGWKGVAFKVVKLI